MTTTERRSGTNELGITATARRVGVTASTLRAWERRYGVRPSGRTRGGHRRYSADDVAVLQRIRSSTESGMSTASAAALNALSSTICPPESRSVSHGSAAGADMGRFADAVRAMNGARVNRVARQLLQARGAAAAWTLAFTPYLQELGDRWANTHEQNVVIAEEHIAVDALQAALRAHATRHGGRARQPDILTAAVPGERHTLPLDALAAALAELRITTGVLCDVPAAVLHAAVARHPGAIVVLWSRGGADMPLLRGLIGQTAQVCAAGPGWRRTRLPAAVPHLASLHSALGTLPPMVGTPLSVGRQ